MTSTFVRIPVPQQLWDAVRIAGQDHVLALLRQERMIALFASNPTEEREALKGRCAEAIDRANGVSDARGAMDAAIVSLAKAEVAHVLGDAITPAAHSSYNRSQK
jgi:hypothetical protein